MEFTLTTANPLYCSINNSFIINTFIKLLYYYPIILKTAIFKISIDNRHCTTKLMIAFAITIASKINSQEITLYLI